MTDHEPISRADPDDGASAEKWADVALRNAMVISALEPARRLLLAASSGPRADLDALRLEAERRERLFDNASAVARKSSFGAVTADESATAADALRTAIVELEAYRRAASWLPAAANPADRGDAVAAAQAACAGKETRDEPIMASKRAIGEGGDTGGREP